MSDRVEGVKSASPLVFKATRKVSCRFVSVCVSFNFERDEAAPKMARLFGGVDSMFCLLTQLIVCDYRCTARADSSILRFTVLKSAVGYCTSLCRDAGTSGGSPAEAWTWRARVDSVPQYCAAERFPGPGGRAPVLAPGRTAQ